jgi:uridine kinase
MPAPASADPASAAAARQVITRIAAWRAGCSLGPGVLVVAVDGYGASGKSTIAGLVTGRTGAALVHTDDFFLSPPAPPGAIEGYYDWRRLQAEALRPLLAGRTASFRRFDWERGRPGELATVTPSSLILVEGVSSAGPALADLVHACVFVDTPAGERLRRLRCRVKPGEWDDDWLAAERAYFGVTRPPSSFDLIVPGSVAAGRRPAPGTARNQS